MDKRKSEIATAFGKAAQSYDDNAEIQKIVSEKLSQFFPTLPSNANILEIGCGTGITTKLIYERYMEANIYLSDIAIATMIKHKEKLLHKGNTHLINMDGEKPAVKTGHFDLCISSMTLQWLNNPVQGALNLIQLLKKHGQIIYATLGQDFFPEWKDAFAKHGLKTGLIQMPEMPGKTLDRQKITISYGNARNFLDSLKRTGANSPSTNYRQNSIRDIAKAAKTFNETNPNGNITWDIVFKKLTL